MPTPTHHILLPLAACLLALAGCGGGAAQAAPLPAERAVALALAHAQEDTPAGRLFGQPTEAHGKLTSYGEATKIITDGGMALAQGSEPGRSVWLVVFEGEAVEHVPASADSTIAQRDAQHAQVSVIIDGSTGEALEWHIQANKVPVDQLPALALPKAAE